ncbi:HAD family hydrolase [Erysipelothrix sp. strain 2 (EsS2-6-Brazil)]|uniref:HAD family hydrolase n=1 Tax=Erysipelothrix sp. strain 2 (EsS2-6-Brazil) TaxID=2500549 RepID=UPI00190ADF90|nr:HAD family phosphatase [Erysipelothrix sp. strain 2 (EsS2-6-Brazil)]
MIQIFASDYDGTLFRNSTVSHDDLEAIRTFRALGNKFGIVTGRTIHSIQAEIEAYNIPVDFIVGINGGVVLTHDHQEIFISDLDQSVVDASAHSMVPNIPLTNLDVLKKERGVQALYLDASAHSMVPNIPLTDLDVLKQERGVQALYVVTSSPRQALALTNHINQHYGALHVEANQNVCAVDIGAHGISKATGLQKIIDYYDYKGPIYTMGDSYNDVPMLKAFQGFVISTGEALVKEMGVAHYSSVGDALSTLFNKK